MAAFMASAYAKFSGGLGVCLATSGPGASHLVTGLYDARLDHMPVLAIAGQQARNALGGHYQQEVDLASLFNAASASRMFVTPGSRFLPFKSPQPQIA
jgi:pyruvate dehydrogenase (quinone)